MAAMHSLENLSMIMLIPVRDGDNHTRDDLEEQGVRVMPKLVEEGIIP